jgi:RimJ/RimL family protein N-acetyltransferase
MEKISLKRVKKEDVSVMYEMLRENVETPNASISENPLPVLEKSKKFVLKYLNDNANHDYKYWYIIIRDGMPVGNIFISKVDYFGYLVKKEFQSQGIATKAIKLLMKKHPRKRYFVAIHNKNKASLRIASKLGFEEKAVILEKKLK